MNGVMSTQLKKTSLAEEETKNDLWDLKWMREPQQDRSARTRADLMDAAEQLLASEGINGVTVAKVAKQAKSSVGSFYHYFQDKNTLIYAVIERNAIEITETVRNGLDPDVWADVPLIDILEGFVRFSLKSGKRNLGIQQAQRKLALEDPNIAARLEKTRRETHVAIKIILKPKLSQIKHPNPTVALELALEVLRTMINHRLGSYVSGASAALPKMSDEAFFREMRTLAASYLQIKDR